MLHLESPPPDMGWKHPHQSLWWENRMREQKEKAGWEGRQLPTFKYNY